MNEIEKFLNIFKEFSEKEEQLLKNKLGEEHQLVISTENFNRLTLEILEEQIDDYKNSYLEMNKKEALKSLLETCDVLENFYKNRLK